MKGILIEPGKEPVVTIPAGHAVGNRSTVAVPCEQKSPATHPGSAGVRHQGQRPEPYLSRPAIRPYPPLWLEGQQHPAHEQGLQAEMLDRPDMEVRV